MKDNGDFAAKDRSKYYFYPSCTNCTSSLSLSYLSLHIVYLEKQRFCEIGSNEEGEKNSFSLSFRFHDSFSSSLSLILLKMQKKITHKQLTCLQQNSEDMHRAGSPQKSLGMDFHRSQASIDHRKVLLCCVDKPVRHGKNLFIFTLGFSAPEGSLQESACSIKFKETAMKKSRTLKISVVFSES